MKSGRRRFSSIASTAPLALALLLALAGSGAALAQQHHQGAQRQARTSQQQPPQQQAARPVMPPTGGARDASWRTRQPQGHMSEEERQQLRRDISDHGRDIYGDRQGQQRR